ncbi:uncharacterized protein BJX67DRAFT_305322 [Aspergillus lucknowensis]|uniref:Uncharacterized protein n=1 Tax=Aspergillus lucknowensis TaxID=176173 RepID=A0ABR4LZV5_9EURO
MTSDSLAMCLYSVWFTTPSGIRRTCGLPAIESCFELDLTNQQSAFEFVYTSVTRGVCPTWELTSDSRSKATQELLAEMRLDRIRISFLLSTLILSFHLYLGFPVFFSHVASAEWTKQWARGGNCVTITDDTTGMFMNRNVFLMSDDTCLLFSSSVLLFLAQRGCHIWMVILSVFWFLTSDHRRQPHISFVCRHLL